MSEKIHNFVFLPDNLKKFKKKYKKFTKLIPKMIKKKIMEQKFKHKNLNVGFKYILSTLATPPVLFTLIGIMIAFIPPVKFFILSETSPIAPLISPVKKLADMFIPISFLIIGAFLGKGFKIDKRVLLKAYYIILVLFSKLVISSWIGIGMTFAHINVFP